MWLYVPPAALPSAPESAGSIWASRWLFRALARSATWRGKSLPPRAWQRQLKRAGFTRRLSGLICAPSMLDAGVARLISSLREIPARETALPESGLDSSTIAGCLIEPSIYFPPAGRVISSAKTSRGTRTDSLPLPSRHWKRWAAALRAEYSARPKPATPCGASDCSSWPSASVMDTADGSDLAKVEARRAKHKARGINGNGFGESLSEKAARAVENWTAPKASDPERAGPNMRGSKAPTLEGAAETWMAPQVPNGGRSTDHAEQVGATLYHNGKKVQLGLESQARNWAAPQARDHFPAHSPERIAAMKAQGHGMRNLNDEAETWRAPSDPSKRGGSQPAEKRQAGGHTVNLEDQAEHWMTTLVADTGEKVTHATKQYSLIHQAERDFDPGHFLPPLSPDPATSAGSTCSTASPNTNRPSARRKLNPIFVEALMRWPTGLSGFVRQETALIRWQLLMRSCLSALGSACSQPDQGNLL